MFSWLVASRGVRVRSVRLVALLALVLVCATAAGPGFCDDEKDRDCQVCHLRHLPLVGPSEVLGVLVPATLILELSVETPRESRLLLTLAGGCRAPPA